MQSKPLAPAELDAYVLKAHPEANFLQTASWGKTYELTGDKVYYLGLYEDNKIVGSCLAIVKPARRGRYLEIPGGPLINWQNKKQVKSTLEIIRDLASSENCVFVRLRPNIPDTRDHRKTLEKLSAKLSPMHLHAEHTVILDLQKSEAELLSSMRRQTRYEVRRAEKLGIKISVDTSKRAFEDFYKNQQQTARRQNFIPASKAFILAQHTAFGDQAKIYTAAYDNEILAQALVLLTPPEAIYNEAASTTRGRTLPGAYALQWQIIKDAKKAGIKRYNLFGIAPPDSPHHRYAGVTTFKKGFGDESAQVNYLPAYDLILSPAKYQLTKLIETIRKKKRNL